MSSGLLKISEMLGIPETMLYLPNFQVKFSATNSKKIGQRPSKRWPLVFKKKKKKGGGESN